MTTSLTNTDLRLSVFRANPVGAVFDIYRYFGMSMQPSYEQDLRKEVSTMRSDATGDHVYQRNAAASLLQSDQNLLDHYREAYL